MRVGVISQAVGSAYIETDRSKVICGVYGPRQSAKSGFSDKVLCVLARCTSITAGQAVC